MDTPGESADPVQKDLFERIRASIHEFLEAQSKDYTEEDKLDNLLLHMQQVHEVLSFHMGFVDGMACIAGASREERLDSHDVFFHAGKRSAHEEHAVTADCNCEGAQALWEELNPN